MTFLFLSQFFVKKRIWVGCCRPLIKRSQNTYVGYGLLKPKDIMDSHVRIFPVKDGDMAHCGLFYLDDAKKILAGDLLEHPEMYDVIYKLCEMIENNLVLR